MKYVNLGAPIQQTPEAKLDWALQGLQAIASASNEDVESVVFDGYNVSGDFTPARTLDTAATSSPSDSSGGTPGTDLAVFVAPDLSAWNGATDPTAAQAAAINAGFATILNNVSTLSAALATTKSENADLRSLIATLITDLRQRGQNRQE